MQVGNLVHLRREPVVEGLPVGIVIETTYNTCGEIWCSILWGDGTQYGAWDSELMEVTNASR